MLGGDRAAARRTCAWRSVYDYFPWEDWRHDRPASSLREDRAAPEGVGGGGHASENGDASVLDCASGRAFPSASTAPAGTTSAFWNATSCCAKPGLVTGPVAAANRELGAEAP